MTTPPPPGTVNAGASRADREVPERICSARGCRSGARWALLWNNPRLHEPARRKVWLACNEHRTDLGDHLRVRGMLRDVVPVDEIPRDAG